MEEGMDASGFEQCLERFEQMMLQNTELYFDKTDLEDLVDHFMMMNEFDKADRAIELAQHQHPGNFEMDMKQAELLTLNGSYERALALLEHLEDVYPDNSYVLVAKGTVYSRQGKHELAISIFEQALITSPEPADVNMIISFEYFNLNDYARAQVHLKSALNIEPMRESLVNELAFCFDQIDRPDDAIEFFGQHVDNHPYCVSAWYNMGLFQMQMGHYSDAIESFGFANAITPNDILILISTGRCYLCIDNYSKAKEAYEEIIEIEPDSIEGMSGLAESLEMLDEYAASTKYCKRILEIDPENADSWYRLASLCIRQEKFIESYEHIKRSIECDDQDSHSWALLAENLLILDQFEEAIAAYDRSIDIDPQQHQSWLAKGISFFHEVDEDEGIRILKEGIEHLSENADLHYGLSALLLLSGREQQGLQYLQLGLDLDADKQSILFQIYPEAAQLPRVLDLIQP